MQLAVHLTRIPDILYKTVRYTQRTHVHTHTYTHTHTYAMRGLESVAAAMTALVTITTPTFFATF